MINIEFQYLEILKELVNQKVKYSNRTGVDTFKLPPKMIQHNMVSGLPILTTRKIPWKSVKVELEGFIKGITSKKWFQERGCHYWDDWCNPQKVPYKNDEVTKVLMKSEDDLGPCIYGASWRGFHDPNSSDGLKVDQLDNLINTLKTDPQNRRMLCLAWNPLGLSHTALPACHSLFQVTTRGNKLDLTWYQRSCDVFLGVPSNLASYGLFLHLLAKEANLEEGILTGFLTDVHLYENHVDAAKTQLERIPYSLPNVRTHHFDSIYEWEYIDSYLDNYNYHPAIKADVAV